MGILVVGIAMLFVMAQPLSAASERAMPSTGTGATSVSMPSGISSTGAIRAGSYTCASGTNPEYVAYDPVNKYYYVSDVNSNNITVFKGTCTLVTTIVLGSGAVPRGVAFDPSNNYVYVAEVGFNSVLEVSGTTVVQTITSGALDLPWGLAFDPAGGYYYGSSSIVVTNLGNGTISYIGTPSPATGTASVDYSQGVGYLPIAVAYSPLFNALMVVNQGSNNVTAIDATTGAIIDPSIAVGSEPQGIAFSPSTDQTYVTNVGSKNVSVIDPVGLEFGAIKVGKDPLAVAFDQSTLEMFVCNYGSNSISVISLSNAVVSTLYPGSGSEPAGLAYNSGDGKMDVVGWGSGLVYVKS